MKREQFLKNISVPRGKVDVVLDTDTYNEIDDQFAIAYLLRSKEKLNTLAIHAAPFYNENSTGPADGMEKSYREIFKVLALMGETVPVFRGSQSYLTDEKTPVISDAAKNLVKLALEHSPDNPLYVVGIGAFTNIASAILIDSSITENIVIVFLGGHAHHYHDTIEFNMYQDIAASRVIMGSGVPFVQLPCTGVVSGFRVSKYELEHWFIGKNPVATYLAENTIRAQDAYGKNRPWTRVIWDVCAVAWLLNDDDVFMLSHYENIRLSDYTGHYDPPNPSLLMSYVYKINRDRLFEDLIDKVCR